MHMHMSMCICVYVYLQGYEYDCLHRYSIRVYVDVHVCVYV